MREPTAEERAQGQIDFVPHFIPGTQWPEPRPAHSQRYRALFQEIADLQNARPNNEDEEQVVNNNAEQRIQAPDSDMED